MKNLLFIQHLIQGDVIALRWWALTIGILAIMVLFSSVIDLVYGIKASKAAGIFQTTSYGIRKTVEKDVSYMMFFLFGIFIDGCLSFFLATPICCVIIAASEILIEGLSVRENMKRIGMSGKDPMDVARAIIKTFGISDAQKIDEVIKYLQGAKQEAKTEEKEHENENPEPLDIKDM